MSISFKKSEEQELLLDGLSKIMEKVCDDSYLRECDLNHERPMKVIKALHDNGYMSLGIPEEYGGTPADLLTLMMVSEEVHSHGLSMNFYVQPLQLHNILNYGSPEQIKQGVEEIMVKGGNAYGLGFTEPGAGSDTSSIQTSYVRKNGKVYINGQKTFITGANDVPYLLCMAKNPEETDPKKAFTLWWVPMNKPGITVKDIEKIGWWMRPSCDVFLENVELDESNMFGTEGNGFLQLMDHFEVERIQSCTVMLGVAKCAFEDAAKYANQRVQFKKRISDFQLTQSKIMQMAIYIENMRNMIYKCALEKMEGKSQQIEAAMCKWYCATGATFVTNSAMQIMGGIGISQDCRVSRFWRDMRIYELAAGSTEIMVHIAGRGLLKKYANKI